ncbi:MAG: PRC-barrel domain-containing protein [Sneathiellaceae bacterium]
MAVVDKDETSTLISTHKVEGTSVYNGEGDQLGSVDSLMVNKQTGKVAYAVMSFGGFLGIGEGHHPLPWEVLHYDTRKDGYVVNLSKDQLRDAPTLGRDEEYRLMDRDYETSIHKHYGVAPYWI